jgi:hypothetical protein
MTSEEPKALNYFVATNGYTIAEGEELLEKVYCKFNARRFNSELPAPVIKITPESLGMASLKLVDSAAHLLFSPYFSFKTERIERTMLHLMCLFSMPRMANCFNENCARLWQLILGCGMNWKKAKRSLCMMIIGSGRW